MRRARPRRYFSGAIAAVLTSWLTGCATTDGEWTARAWKRGDALFHSDPRWLGADAAYSVPLDGDRVLWLFGDTFIGDGSTSRREATFIRNSVAIQTGLNVRDANITFHWGRDGDTTTSFFPATADAWLWPVHGVYRNGVLTLFFTRVMGATDGLGFKLAGVAALRCDDLSGVPESWQFRSLDLPNTPGAFAMVFGVALIDAGDHVYAYCDAELDGHTIYLLRWRTEDFDAGRLAAAQWWDGKTFAYEGALRDGLSPVFRHGASEFSVQPLADGRYLQIQSHRFPSSDIRYRVAPRPEGPWSEPTRIFLPPESRRRGTLVYAAKAHPELADEGLLVTYAANHFDPKTLLEDRSLYYPRFVRLQRAK